MEIPSLESSHHPRKTPEQCLASNVLKRDEVMCGTDGLSFREVIAGLVPGPCVWEIRPGIFCPSFVGS